jgi:hypothetical protein
VGYVARRRREKAERRELWLKGERLVSVAVSIVRRGEIIF